MKIATFLGCHQRQFDLHLALEICEWHAICPTYVIYTGPDRLDIQDNIRYFSAVETDNQNAGWCMLQSIRWAKELGCDRHRFTNCDDLLLNKEFVQQHFLNTEQVTAYNWLTIGTMADFAINENYFDTDWAFAHLAEAEWCFKLRCSVEQRFGHWLRRTNPTLCRLKNRERSWGIGTRFGEEIPDNSRFFNRAMGLLGHHNLQEKYRHYLQLCGEPYMEDCANLETMPYFQNFLNLGCQTLL